MNDFCTLEKSIVRELSCRLCLCNDVVKLKPLSTELKRKLKSLFNINIRTDDNLPKAICHDCLQQVSTLHLYTVKVEKTQTFLQFHKVKTEEAHVQSLNAMKLHPIVKSLSSHNVTENVKKTLDFPKSNSSPSELQQSNNNTLEKSKQSKKHRRSRVDLKYMEAMSLDEFAKTEHVDKALLNVNSSKLLSPRLGTKVTKEQNLNNTESNYDPSETLDCIVLIDGKPAKQGAALDKQITFFYKMECAICHENGFNFRSLMKHYKDRHGVPGYVSCCDKKFHYFYPKKIIEHMAYHLQPNIFMCQSCHQNFQTSQELTEHESNGGRSEGKIICPRCTERYPTYHELGKHIIIHRTDKYQCDYCGKILKHHHRKKTINRMEDLILCSQCIRSLKSIERNEKEIREKVKAKGPDAVTLQKYQKFRQALNLSGDEDASTD